MKKIIIALTVLLAGITMATAAIYTNFVSGGYGYAWKDAGFTFVVESVIDYSDTDYAGLAAGEVTQVIPIESNSLVHAVYWEILDDGTNKAATSNISIGDGTQPGGYVEKIVFTNEVSTLSGASTFSYMLSTTNTGYNVVQPLYAYGKYYTTRDTIDVLNSNIVHSGKLKVSALVTDFGKKRN